MADWRDRALIFSDVVFFRYKTEEVEKNFEEVFVWDVDKTYLDTSWASLGDLWKTIVEKALQKKNVPGTKALVRALSQAWTEEYGKIVFPIFFITASPPQMESRIREKLELDEIRPVGAFFKDNLRNLKPGRLRWLTQQVGYKLQALLFLRIRLNSTVRQVCWGDDSEYDAIIYSLYSDICSRRQSEDQLIRTLTGLHVTSDQIDVILDLQEQVPIYDPVEKIYINLAVDTDPEYYLKFGRRVVPTANSFQLALDLFQDSRLSLPHVIRVGQDLKANYGFTLDQLDDSFDDLVRRQILGAQVVAKCIEELKAAGLLSSRFRPSIEPRPIAEMKGQRVFRLEGVHEPWIPDVVEYLKEYR